MSNTAPATPDQAALQNAYEQAYATVRYRLYAPALFGKLASDYGIQPADDEEAQSILTIVDQLRAAGQTTSVKEASARKQLLQEASADLSRVTGAPPATAAAETQQIKAAAAELVESNPTLRDAALLYRDYLGQVLAAQQAAGSNG